MFSANWGMRSASALKAYKQRHTSRAYMQNTQGEGSTACEGRVEGKKRTKKSEDTKWAKTSEDKKERRQVKIKMSEVKTKMSEVKTKNERRHRQKISEDKKVGEDKR